jgi:lipopolysaccharide export LptBFGC system permease protein LptF
VRAGENRVLKGLGFSLLSFLLGWWGIPWGPIYTVQALWNNFQGGKDVTTEVLASLKN